MAALMSVCVIELQPGLACLGKPYNIRSMACQPEDNVHLCEEFLTREAPEVKG